MEELLCDSWLVGMRGPGNRGKERAEKNPAMGAGSDSHPPGVNFVFLLLPFSVWRREIASGLAMLVNWIQLD